MSQEGRQCTSTYVLSVVLYVIMVKQNISSAKKCVKLGEGPSCGRAQCALQDHGLQGGRRAAAGVGVGKLARQ